MTTNPKSSKELIGSMRSVLDAIERLLRDKNLTAATQVADVQTCCWGLVQATFLLQRAVDHELHGVEDNDDDPNGDA